MTAGFIYIQKSVGLPSCLNWLIFMSHLILFEIKSGHPPPWEATKRPARHSVSYPSTLDRMQHLPATSTHTKQPLSVVFKMVNKADIPRSPLRRQRETERQRDRDRERERDSLYKQECSLHAQQMIKTRALAEVKRPRKDKESLYKQDRLPLALKITNWLN